MEGIDLGKIAIWFPVFLLSLSIHECAHALAANWSGDPTGRYQGRITLNPMAHIDPIGTILVPLSMMIYGGGAFMFGWAKPVPFNPLNLRDRKLGEIVIAAAGPASNVLLLVICAVLMKIFFYSTIFPIDFFGGYAGGVKMFLNAAIVMNIVLAVFNMIPVPPLDGSHILRNLLPDTLADMYSQISPLAGLLILIVLMYNNVTLYLALPFFQLVQNFLGPGY